MGPSALSLLRADFCQQVGWAWMQILLRDLCKECRVAAVLILVLYPAEPIEHLSYKTVRQQVGILKQL